jgi:phospholipid transport system transporter-binding protein
VSIVKLSVLPNEALLSGELTRQTISLIKDKEVEALLKQNLVVINLEQVIKIDTAGLAWLFALLEKAQTRNCCLTFAGLPNKLKKLISLSGVEGFLPVESD